VYVTRAIQTHVYGAMPGRARVHEHDSAKPQQRVIDLDRLAPATASVAGSVGVRQLVDDGFVSPGIFWTDCVVAGRLDQTSFDSFGPSRLVIRLHIAQHSATGISGGVFGGQEAAQALLSEVGPNRMTFPQSFALETEAEAG